MTAVAPRPAERAAPEERGTLRVDRSVVRKIAERAADSSPATLPVARRLAGVELGEHGAKAALVGDGERVRVEIDVALHYPAHVPAAVEDVRDRVITEVERLTGYQVRGVDVTVSALRPATQPRVE